eukprot:TRINITY_DN558_c0_g1_i2.p3 TRINITY_DN558_c0_g1~~TRINITY_DN558_c0_g1_i2.p3  ORF type:complete len:100 (-),score=32.32 TRINITY_DN558_c0_g1_i2:166-465(-)
MYCLVLIQRKILKLKILMLLYVGIQHQQKTTCLVPGVLSPQMYECIDGKRYNDGGIALVCGDKRIWEMKNKYDEDCKVLYINVDFASGICGKRQWHRKR